jgi:hypothetical protein
MIALLSLLLVSPSAHPHGSLRQSLDRIADRCHLRREAFQLESGGLLHFRPEPSTPYRDVDCALGQIRKHRLTRHLPMGFVGNEAYDPAIKP